MVIPSVGSVVLVPFPFSDLSQTKLRPAVVLADSGKNDWILSQITSNPYGDPGAITLNKNSFRDGSLQLVSYVRPGKLFTSNSKLIIKRVGLIKNDVLETIIEAVINIFQQGVPVSG